MPNSLSRATVSSASADERSVFVGGRAQGFGGDAARVQARSAEVGAFDEGDFNSGFRGGECGGVTSGAAPDDGQLHDALPPLQTLCDTLMPSKMDAVIRQFLTIFAQWSTLAA